MTSIGVLADIHGNILALEAVAADLERRNVGAVVVLGDHLSGPLWPRKTAECLMSRDWILISGNHDRTMTLPASHEQGLSDRQALQALTSKEVEWLKSLRPSAMVEDGVLAFHGTPSDNSTYLLETVEHGRTRLASPAEIRERLGATRARVMLCGHTHVPRIVSVAADRLIVNPGSVGLPAYDDDRPAPHVVETGSPDARYAVLERRDGAWIVELISVPYDHHSAARQARGKRRLDWEMALLTGRMSAP